MVEWIEIVKYVGCGKTGYVSTLVVEWIEIPEMSRRLLSSLVSTLVVEWIEIQTLRSLLTTLMSLHPRGGVD